MSLDYQCSSLSSCCQGTCFNNSGLQWAYYVNPDQLPNVDDNTGYSAFDPTLLKTLTPMYTSTTTAMTIYGDGTAPIHIYGSPKTFPSTYFALNHRGYIYAVQSGTYTFTSHNSDEIVLYWIGSKAYSGWTRANADLDDAIYSPRRGQLITFTTELQEGHYYALRIVFANAQIHAIENISVTAPDGTSFWAQKVFLIHTLFNMHVMRQKLLPTHLLERRHDQLMDVGEEDKLFL